MGIWSHPQKLGADLTRAEQNEVLRGYVHRFTREHTPAWARKPMPNGSAYPVQFDSDSDWLRHTYFAVTKSGRLHSGVHECHSMPTWPDNPELRKG
jgi:hypothetical protein